MRNITKDIRNKVIRKCEGKSYYFNQDGIYREVTFEEAEKMNLLYQNWGRNGRYFTLPYYFMGFVCKNETLIKKAISRLKVGDTIEDFDKYLSTTVIEKHKKPEGLNRFITKINTPIFQRIPENTNKDTFDYIYVEVNLVRKWEEDRITYIKKHKEEIFRMVLNKLESNRSFQRFGVPLNFLKISRITLKNNSVLEVVFELKNLQFT